MKKNYLITYYTYEHPKEIDFQQHFHDYSEIFIYLEGSASYEVEASSYTLEPFDILIIPKYKLHGIRHNENKKYSRIVIWIEDEFFANMGCPEYKEIFNKKSEIKISSIISEISGLRDIILKFKKYSNNFKSSHSKISEACLIELLHVINNINESSTPTVKNSNIQNIISYINKEFRNDLTLDLLSEKFYISKYHLCREFKKLTGHTIHEYINLKKLQQVKELRSSGMNISNACIEAGFNSYSSFYRYYKKHFSETPGLWLKN